jgi:hypothetical protein
MSELYLHIGSSKTGSTSIQRTFFKSNEKLLKHGYFYSTRSVNNTFSSEAFNSQCGTKIRDDARDDLFQFLADFNESGVDKAIISSEYLSFLNSQSLADLSAVLRQYFDSITVICYVRHPLAHCASQIQQYVKRGIGSLDSYYKHPPYFSPVKVLPIFKSFFGNDRVICRAFEREQLIGNDVVQDFCNVIGLEFNALNSVREDNVSLSNEYLLMADLLYKLKQRKENYDLKGVLITDLFKKTNIGGKFTLPHKVTTVVSQSITLDLEYINKEYDIELLEPKTLIESAPPCSNIDFMSSVLQNAINYYRETRSK